VPTWLRFLGSANVLTTSDIFLVLGILKRLISDVWPGSLNSKAKISSSSLALGCYLREIVKKLPLASKHSFCKGSHSRLTEWPDFALIEKHLPWMLKSSVPQFKSEKGPINTSLKRFSEL
jgi:hypothetical protein